MSEVPFSCVKVPLRVKPLTSPVSVVRIESNLPSILFPAPSPVKFAVVSVNVRFCPILEPLESSNSIFPSVCETLPVIEESSNLITLFEPTPVAVRSPVIELPLTKDTFEVVLVREIFPPNFVLSAVPVSPPVLIVVVPVISEFVVLKLSVELPEASIFPLIVESCILSVAVA